MTVEIEHSVALLNKYQSSKLTFAKVDTGQMLQYAYTEVANGSFELEKSSGRIQLTSFSLWGILSSDTDSAVEYIAGVLVHRQKRGRYKLAFIASQGLAAYEEVLTLPINVACMHSEREINITKCVCYFPTSLSRKCILFLNGHIVLSGLNFNSFMRVTNWS